MSKGFRNVERLGWDRVVNMEVTGGEGDHTFRILFEGKELVVWFLHQFLLIIRSLQRCKFTNSVML